MNSASLTKSKQNTIIEPMYSTYMYMLASHYQASKTPQWLNSLTLFPNLMDPCPIVHAHCNMEGSQGNEGRFYCHIQLQGWFLGQEGGWGLWHCILATTCTCMPFPPPPPHPSNLNYMYFHLEVQLLLVYYIDTIHNATEVNNIHDSLERRGILL